MQTDKKFQVWSGCFLINLIMLLICFVYVISNVYASDVTDESGDMRNEIRNERPIIGILSQKILRSLTPYIGNDSTYIAASYVKWIEGSGAQVIPILSTYSKTKVLKLVRSINGVVFPGGVAHLNNSNFFHVTRWIYDEAVRMYDIERRPFPIWGTCLGFETLSISASGEPAENILGKYKAENLLLPLDFTKEAFDSRMFKEIDMKLMRDLMFKKLSLHMHQAGISPDLYEKNERIRKVFKVLATNLDKQGKEFVSIIEGRKYPFYGVQFHPEKNIYEWTRRERINHSAEAVRAAQYFANFFVNEARKSRVKNIPMSRLKELEKQLMFRYSPVYSGGLCLFEQVYTFKNHTLNNKIPPRDTL